MSNNSQHVIRSADGGWSVKKGGSSKATKVFSTQQEAIEFGKTVARNQHAVFYIHSIDGTIKEKVSYRSASDANKANKED